MYQLSFPVVNLDGDSSRARHSKKGNPILKCRRCAKEEEERAAREAGMGCGYEAPEDVVEDETSEATLDLGCDKCQDKRRKKKRAQTTSIFPSGILSLQGQVPQGLLRQVPLARQGSWPSVMGNGGRGGRPFSYRDEDDRRHRYCDPSVEWCPTPLVTPVMLAGSTCPGHARMGQVCPTGSVGLDPTLNCQRDARGNAVCSNGLYFPPGCPKTPPEEYFSPGIAPDEVQGGILQAKIPPPRSAGSAAPGAAGGTTNILPYAAGGIAALGLLYAIFR